MNSRPWRIEKIVPGGAGMARLADGRVGFALGALPGETISVDEEAVQKGVVTAKRFRVLESAPERMTPPCAFAEQCGGCDLLHVRYDAQLGYKAALVHEALRRTGGFHDLPPVAIEGSPAPLGYRSRIRVHIDETGKLGFHARKSHRLVEVTSCSVASPQVNEALSVFRGFAQRDPAAAAAFSEAELRVAPTATLPSVLLVRRTTPRDPRPFMSALASEFRVSVAGAEPGHVERWPIARGVVLHVPATAFVQVNWSVNRRIVEALLDEVKQLGLRTFVDLYAGSGNFGLPLLAAGLSGTLVEAHASAAQGAADAVREHAFGGAQILAKDAAEGLRELTGMGAAADLVVLDPPRAGAASLIEPLAAFGSRFVAYCSCDPVTLARDLKALVSRGYTLQSVRAFDMFPGTHHVETLAWLRKSTSAG